MKQNKNELENMFDNAQTMHQQEFISYYSNDLPASPATPVQKEGSFTGGEWYLENQPKGTGRDFETIICGENLVIAVMNRDKCKGKNLTPCYSKEQEANAALIAESKNMYKEMQKLGKAIEEGDPQTITDQWLYHCLPILNRINQQG